MNKCLYEMASDLAVLLEVLQWPLTILRLGRHVFQLKVNACYFGVQILVCDYHLLYKKNVLRLHYLYRHYMRELFLQILTCLFVFAVLLL
jgi:hypothetical protein